MSISISRDHAWRWFCILAAALYFVSFYRMRHAFVCEPMTAYPIIDRRGFFANNLWAQALLCTALFGFPGLLAIYISKRSVSFMGALVAALFAWTILIYSQGAWGLDGQNGCADCDFGILFTLIASVISLVPAALVAKRTAL